MVDINLWIDQGNYLHSPSFSFAFCIKGSSELRGVKIMAFLMYISGFLIESHVDKAFTLDKIKF